MANTIEILIKAEDAASTVLKSVIGSLDSVGSGAVKVGGLLTAVTAPITGLLGLSLQQASEAEAGMAQLNAVLKSTGGVAGVTADMASDLAGALQKVTRYSDDAVLGAENMLLTFTSINKDIFPQTTELALDMSAALGQDLKSSAIQLGKALNDPITGVTALRRVGVQFTDSQMEMIKSLVESGDLMQAQTLVLKELQREFGGSARAAGETFAGKLDILKNKVSDIQERIGFALIPTVQKLTDSVGGVVDKIADWMDANPALTETIVKVAAALVVVGPALIGVGSAMKVIAAVAPVVKTVLGALVSPVGLLIGGLTLLASVLGVNIVGGLQSLLDSIGVFQGRLQEFGGDIPRTLRSMLLADEDGSSLVSTILEGFGMARAEAQAWGAKIGEVAASVVDTITNIVDTIKSSLPLVPFYAQYYFNKIWSAVQPALQPLLDWFTGSGDDSLSGVLSSVPAWIDENVIAPLRGIWVIVEPYVQQIVDWFNNDFYNTVMEVAGWIDTHIVQRLKDLWTQLQPVLTPIADFVRGVFQPVIDFINGVFDSAANTFEMLRRLGGGTPQRTLPGEISPGILMPSGYDKQLIPLPAPQRPAGVGADWVWDAKRQQWINPNPYQGFTLSSSQASNSLGSLAYNIGSVVGQIGQTIQNALGTYTYLGSTPGPASPFPTRDSYGPGVAGHAYFIGAGVQPEVFVAPSNGQFMDGRDLGRSVTVEGDIVLSFPNVNRLDDPAQLDRVVEALLERLGM